MISVFKLCSINLSSGTWENRLSYKEMDHPDCIRLTIPIFIQLVPSYC
jgi:hypothetical protein